MRGGPPKPRWGFRNEPIRHLWPYWAMEMLLVRNVTGAVNLVFVKIFRSEVRILPELASGLLTLRKIECAFLTYSHF